MDRGFLRSYLIIFFLVEANCQQQLKILFRRWSLKNSKIFEDSFNSFKYLTVYKKFHIKVIDVELFAYVP